jgi:outer membrane receptor protein involved in Fe transport
LLGGSPDLVPEKATTKTLGLVVQPRMVPRLAVTIDWYDIKVTDAIQGFGSDAIINFCTATADPFACSLIQRAPVSGSLWLQPQGFIRNLSRNIGSVRTSGIDVGASYSHEIGSLGSLALSFQGTRLNKFKVNNGLSEPYDCAGYYGTTCSQGADGVPSGPNAKWRHKARASFSMDNGLGLSVQWRYFGAVKVDFRNPSSTTAGDFDAFSSKLKAQNYFDLAATYGFGDHFNFRLGVNNIFDREPPLVTSGRPDGTRSQCPTGPCNGNTYPAVYDALGRYLFAGVTVDF